MKPIAIFIVVAAFTLATVAAGAKTITSSQGNANDKSVAGVAGPTVAANASHKVPDNMAGKMTALASKKKAKTRTAQTQKPVPTTD